MNCTCWNDPGDDLNCVLHGQKAMRLYMDNQHRKITGYRELNQEEVDLMNKIKAKAAEVGELVDELKNLRVNSALDQRWVAIGATHMQEGFMALTRAVAKPEFF